MLCVLIVEGMSVVVNVMLSLMSVMSPPPALCNLSVRTAVKFCILGVLALGVLVGMVLSGSPVAACFRSEITRFDTYKSATIWAIETPSFTS